MRIELCRRLEQESGPQSQTRWIMFIWSGQNLQEVGEKKIKTGLQRRRNIRRRGAQHANRRRGCIVHVIRGCWCVQNAMGTIVKQFVVHWSSHLISLCKKIDFWGVNQPNFWCRSPFGTVVFLIWSSSPGQSRAFGLFWFEKSEQNTLFYHLSIDKLISLFALTKNRERERGWERG